ncbi:hypothetical protein B5M42_000920 [Paenibacillus athensensis]|uniref:PPM-type phosphatase domain-containing protein n=1 Tax=Paenibacillus athensensis TaxID=1967502 RepID=A0A4Y8Q724_9BACL|nr:hypothetical protein [Paenibacillus athensensis]MCD1257397.1 hypothetical protein [Paenibacillus athensensis]
MASVRIQLPQSQETDIQEAAGVEWIYHYGYSRSAESREGGDDGQDYVSLLEDENSLCFVVCDGISMSYFGDFAARFLGNALIEWLQELARLSLPENELQSRLTRFLIEKASDATIALQEHVIPETIRGMLREVLLAKKQKGSGAMFACGRLDRPNDLFPNGRLVLAWHGDVRLRLWKDGAECSEQLGERLNTNQQWNSAMGPVGGAPRVVCQSLNNGQESGGVLLYSDGLQTLDGLASVSKDGLKTALKREAMDPSSDDMSVVHVRWAFPERT